MPTYQITATPLQLSNPYSAPYEITNTGSVAIYLGLTPQGVGSSVNPLTKDKTLTPGSSTILDGNSFVWIVTDPGFTSTVEQVYNAISGSVLGPSAVALVRPPVLLAKQTLTVNPANATSLMAFLAQATTYQSLIVVVEIAGTGFPGPKPQNWVEVSLNLNNAGSIVIADPLAITKRAQWLIQPRTGAELTYQISLIGITTPTILVGVAAHNLIGDFTTCAITVSVYGSGEAVPGDIYQNLANNSAFYVGSYFSQIAGSNVTAYLPTKNGLANLGVINTGGSGAPFAALTANWNGALYRIEQVITPSDQQVLLQNVPMSLLMITAVATTTDYALTQ